MFLDGGVLDLLLVLHSFRSRNFFFDNGSDDDDLDIHLSIKRDTISNRDIERIGRVTHSLFDDTVLVVSDHLLLILESLRRRNNSFFYNGGDDDDLGIHLSKRDTISNKDIEQVKRITHIFFDDTLLDASSHLPLDHIVRHILLVV